jgi:hypothetical protein
LKNTRKTTLVKGFISVENVGNLLSSKMLLLYTR